jgi:organic radical activating enzyme
MKQHVPIPGAKKRSGAALPLGDEVVIYGAGPLALLVLQALSQRATKPVCVCVTGAADEPVVAKGRIGDIPVKPQSEARTAYPRATVIITTAPARVASIKSDLQREGWQDVVDSSKILSCFDYDVRAPVTGACWRDLEVLDDYFFEYFKVYHPSRVVLLSLDIVITERCSLRCRDCSNLMQYYATPQDADWDELFAALDILMSRVDHVMELRVLGGESFMNPIACEYVRRLRQYSNYTRIAVYSNGTICPPHAHLGHLAHDDTYLRIADYGQLSRKTREITAACDDLGVSYTFDVMPGWHDCALIQERARKNEELKTVYESCCANRLFTLLHGRLYPCPFSAHATNLGAIPFFPEDSVGVKGNIIEYDFSAWLKRCFQLSQPLHACRYCAGRPVNVLPLPVAAQCSSPLHFTRAGAYRENAPTSKSTAKDEARRITQ